jgi:hypothetical protein
MLFSPHFLASRLAYNRAEAPLILLSRWLGPPLRHSGGPLAGDPLALEVLDQRVESRVFGNNMEVGIRCYVGPLRLPFRRID